MAWVRRAVIGPQAVLLLLVGCDGDRVLRAPDDIAFVAATGPALRSPLLPLDDAARLITDDAEATTILGYRAEQLSPTLMIDPSEPLSLEPRGCGLLPAPAWASTWSGAEISAPAALLSARWAEVGCPTPQRLHLSCRDFRVCSGVPTPTEDRCSWSVGCNDGDSVRVHAGVWPSAPGCARLGSDASPTPLRAESWSADRTAYRAIAPLDGRSCAIAGDGAPLTPLEIPAADQVRVWTGNPRLPASLDNAPSPFLDLRALRGGGVTGLVLDKPRGRAIVAVTDNIICPTERNAARGAWRTVDLDDVALSTRTVGLAPACLMGVRRIGADDTPLRIIGFTVDSRANLLVGHEFDAALTEVRRSVLTHVPADVLVADVLVTPERWWVLTTQTGGTQYGAVHAVDPERWVVTATLAPGLGAAHTLELDAAGQITAFLRARTDVCTFDVVGGLPRCTPLCGPEVFAPTASVIKLTAMARDPADGAPVLAASDAFHGLFACGPELWLQPAEGDAQMVTVAALSPGRMVASALGRWDGQHWSGRLLIADLAAGGFEPQSYALPGGAAATLLPDGERWWILMPWDGVLLRWRPPTR